MVRVHPGPPARHFPRIRIWMVGVGESRHGELVVRIDRTSRISWDIARRSERRLERAVEARKSTGAVAQLGERGLCKPEVVGSIPSSSTRSHESFVPDIELRSGVMFDRMKNVRPSGEPAPNRREVIFGSQRSLITEYLSELRASCLQDNSRRSRETSFSLEWVPTRSSEDSTLPNRFMVKLRRADGGCLGGRRR